MNKKNYESVDILKVILTAIVILSAFIIPGKLGAYLSPLCCFSGCGFFFLYGYFMLYRIEEDDSRLKRSIGRLFIAFAISATVYFGLYCAEVLISDGNPFDLFTKRNIFNFLVLNIWSPSIGFNVFFLQAALYAAIVCYLANKLKLMRFSLPVMIVLFLAATALGEGAGLINFSFLGYRFISGNFLTRALPYMLLGRMIHQCKANNSFRMIKSWVWALIFVVGAMLSFLEIVGLAVYNKIVYLNHLVGFIPMTISACMIALRSERTFAIGKYCRDMYTAMFYLYTVVSEMYYMFIWTRFPENTVSISYLGFITLGITAVLAGLYSFLKNRNKVPIHQKGIEIEQ